MNSKSKTMQAVQTTVKIKGNVAIPADKFTVLAGYSF